MEPITRLTGENFHKRGGKNHMNSSLTGSSFYLHENKTETYQTLIQMLKSDLIQIQDMKIIIHLILKCINYLVKHQD